MYRFGDSIKEEKNNSAWDGKREEKAQISQRKT